MSADPAADLADRLAARLTTVLGGPVRVTGLRRLSGGASRETWAFDADGQPLILRRDPPAVPRPAEMAREAAALAVAARGGVPVPRLVDHGDGADTIGSPYLIMDRLDGETIPRRLLRDERFAAVRPGLARTLGAILARVHALPPEEVPGLPGGDPLDALAAQYDELGEPRPAFELALRWLRRHRPPSGGDVLVHGDFRNGNLMIAPDGVRGVLDWELTHRGDPYEDLGWLCVKAWRFGAPAPAGGFGSRADLLDGYVAAGGVAPSAETLRWWETYGTLHWAVLCRHQAERYLSGSDPSIELAALGRRVCEQEHDLLLILGLAEPRAVPDPLASGIAGPAGSGSGELAGMTEGESPERAGPGGPAVGAVSAGAAASAPAGGGGGSSEPGAAGPHDRPGASALIDAVGAFLSDEVARTADERLRFHALVAASALRIARRELLLGAVHQEAHRRRLAVFGCRDDAELARAIRAGDLDGRLDEVAAAVRDTVADKLIVANPRHLAVPGG